MATFNSRIRQDTDPYVIWNAKEVNEELSNIDTRISSLNNALLDLNSNQTIEGQKTFLTLFFENQTPTYETALEIMQNDISPVFTTGAKAITSLSGEELAFTKPNVSGVISPMALRNPIYRRGALLIYNSGNSVLINIKNIPFAAYDLYKIGTKPNTNGTNIEAYYWATSQSIDANIDLSTAIGGVIAGERYEIIAGFKDTTGDVDTFIVREGYSSSISSEYKSFRRLSFFKLDGSSDIINFRHVDDTYFLYSYQPIESLNSFIQDTCIVKAKLINATAFNTIIFGGNIMHILEGSGASGTQYGYGYPNQDFYLAMIWNQGSFPEISPEGILYFNTILVGGLF